MTYKEKVMKRIENSLEFGSIVLRNSTSVANKGESIRLAIGLISATFFLGKVVISYRDVEVPLEKEDALEIYTLLATKYAKYEEERKKKILEEL